VNIRRTARAAYESFWHYFGFVYFGAVGALYGIVASVLRLILPARLRAPLGRRLIGFLFRGFLRMMTASGVMKLDLSALDVLRGQPGLVIAPNHPCLLDAVFVIAHVPEVSCIMKAEIWDNVVLGGGARLAGYIRNDSTNSMVRASAQELRDGRPLLVFPEGTRTRRGPVNQFKGGFALIAKVARAPIQTVFIETDSPFLGKGWPLLKKPRFPLVYRARLGKRLTVDGDLKAFIHQLEVYYRDELSGHAAQRPSPVLHSSSSPRPGRVSPTKLLDASGRLDHLPRTQVVSGTHLVLIPSYNTGEKVVETVRDARSHWNPVWVVVDGSTDGTAEQLREMATRDAGLRVFTLPRNQGKGAAVLHGLREAVAQGYTHALAMDADGQHPAARIPEFMAASEHAPEALILGKPVFDASAPRVRVIGRRVSNGWANLETLWAGIGDSLFGFRVYPIRPLLAVMEVRRWMRRFDFDVEAVVRLVWRGLPPINLPASVRYFRPEEGGVSHFNYVRDNLLLSWMHARLFTEFLLRLPWLAWRRACKDRRTWPLSETRRQHWTQISEFGSVAGMRLMFSTCRILGRWPFRVVLYPVLLWYMVTKPEARASSSDYLRRIATFQGASRIRPGMVTVLRHFASFAENLLDKMLLWSGLFKTDRVEFHGQEQMVALMAAQRGGLLICSHLGNLELCRILSRRVGFKLTVLVHTKHAQIFNRLLGQLDPKSQLNLMQVTEISPATAVLLSEKIGRGEFVAIAGDRIPVSSSPRVALAKFLGETAPFPVGPYILASLLQCPTYLMFSMRTGHTSEIHFELFRESIHLPHKGRDEALANLVGEYARRLEHFCLRAPLQWFNFYDFWHLPALDTPDAFR
jgi:1-acyl-sn-glycerol-3-phosphate acyltransferase